MKGISWDKSFNNWVVSSRIGKKTIKFGRFDSYEDAYYLRLAVNQCLYPEELKCLTCGNVIDVDKMRSDTKYCSKVCKTRSLGIKIYQKSDAYKASVRKCLYNLSPEDYDKMLEDQGGRCKICNDNLITPYVDHCHTTQLVRGLLCNNCNRGIGFLKDSGQILQAAANYVNSFKDLTTSI